MRILYLHAGAEMYGADRILLELVRGMIRRGHRCIVVLPWRGPLADALSIEGAIVEVCNLGILRRKYFTIRGVLDRLLKIVCAAYRLRRLVHAYGVDIIHSNTTGVLVGSLLARVCNLPHVWHVHEITRKPTWFAVLISRIVALGSDRVVCVSKATEDQLLHHAKDIRRVSSIIYNGISPERATRGKRGSLRAEVGWADGDVVIGMIGRINWWKGHSIFLEAGAMIMRVDHRVRLLLVGGTFPGEEYRRTDLERQIDDMGHPNQVMLLDYREEIADLFADIDIFVLPSIEPDPLPTVVLEAMAAGKPVVAFRHGGVCEMIEHGSSGLLCWPVNAERLADSVSEILADCEGRARLGWNAREKFARDFSIETFLTRFEALYAETGANYVRKS